MGFAQIVIVSGLCFICFSVLLWKGRVWAKWPLYFLPPCLMIIGTVKESLLGLDEFDHLELLIIGVPITFLWIWSLWGVMKEPDILNYFGEH